MGDRRHETGWYRDRAGVAWHCVATETSMVCRSTEFFTSAYHETFARWGWERINHDFPATRPAKENEGHG